MSSARVVADDAPPQPLTIALASSFCASVRGCATPCLRTWRSTRLARPGCSRSTRHVGVAARMQAVGMLARHHAVDVQEGLVERMVAVGALEVAGAVAVDAVAQDQVLRARGRADRVVLNEAQPRDRLGRRRGAPQRPRDRVTAQRSRVHAALSPGGAGSGPGRGCTRDGNDRRARSSGGAGNAAKSLILAWYCIRPAAVRRRAGCRDRPAFGRREWRPARRGLQFGPRTR
jgi:hypothetical protein